MKKQTKPVGRDAVKTALIESAAELFAERGIKDVSLREIAAHAGVNLGLIHRHFGSKEVLRRAAQEFLASKFQEQLGGLTDFEDTFMRLRQITDKRVIGMLTRSLLEDSVKSDYSNSYLFVEGLMGLVREEQGNGTLKSDMGVEEIVIGLLAMGFGIELFKDVLFVATGSKKKPSPKNVNKIIMNWISLIKK